MIHICTITDWIYDTCKVQIIVDKRRNPCTCSISRSHIQCSVISFPRIKPTVPFRLVPDPKNENKQRNPFPTSSLILLFLSHILKVCWYPGYIQCFSLIYHTYVYLYLYESFYTPQSNTGVSCNIGHVPRYFLVFVFSFISVVGLVALLYS